MVTKTNDKTEIFKTAIIALIVALGVTAGGKTMNEVFENELKDYYVCSLTEDIAEFPGGISGTGYSGYPFTDSRKSASKCGTTDNKGEWIPIAIYAESLGIDAYDLLEKVKDEEGSKELVSPPSTSVGGGIAYSCPPAGVPCIPIE